MLFSTYFVKVLNLPAATDSNGNIDYASLLDHLLKQGFILRVSDENLLKFMIMVGCYWKIFTRNIKIMNDFTLVFDVKNSLQLNQFKDLPLSTIDSKIDLKKLFKLLKKGEIPENLTNMKSEVDYKEIIQKIANKYLTTLEYKDNDEKLMKIITIFEKFWRQIRKKVKSYVCKKFVFALIDECFVSLNKSDELFVLFKISNWKYFIYHFKSNNNCFDSAIISESFKIMNLYLQLLIKKKLSLYDFLNKKKIDSPFVSIFTIRRCSKIFKKILSKAIYLRSLIYNGKILDIQEQGEYSFF